MRRGPKVGRCKFIDHDTAMVELTAMFQLPENSLAKLGDVLKQMTTRKVRLTAMRLPKEARIMPLYELARSHVVL